MSRPEGQLERSLAALTIGMAHGQQKRKDALRDTHTGEYEQQVHVPISGVAFSTWGFVDKTVKFQMPFVYAPLQRTVPFETPHFTFGVEMLTGHKTLIRVDVHVLAWVNNEANWITGANVRFAVQAPMLADGVSQPYSAIAHLSFQGYATFAEGDEFDDGQ